MKSQIGIFLDMDGVLADFDKAAKANFNFDTSRLNMSRSLMTPADALLKDQLYEQIEQLENFWLTLEPISDAQVLFEFFKDFNPVILTAAPSNKGIEAESFKRAARHKREWIREHFPVPDTHFLCTTSSDKHLYMNHLNKKVNILVDDRLKNIDNWHTAGGLGIFHTSAQNSIDKFIEFQLY